MNSIQEPVDPLPRPAEPHHTRQKWILPLVITFASTIIAVIWALSSTGHIDSQWSGLALIFFTWIAVVMGAWAIAYKKE